MVEAIYLMEYETFEDVTARGKMRTDSTYDWREIGEQVNSTAYPGCQVATTIAEGHDPAGGAGGWRPPRQWNSSPGGSEEEGVPFCCIE
jgi:hypothetical protein